MDNKTNNLVFIYYALCLL